MSPSDQDDAREADSLMAGSPMGGETLHSSQIVEIYNEDSYSVPGDTAPSSDAGNCSLSQNAHLPFVAEVPMPPEDPENIAGSTVAAFETPVAADRNPFCGRDTGPFSRDIFSPPDLEDGSRPDPFLLPRASPVLEDNQGDASPALADMPSANVPLATSLAINDGLDETSALVPTASTSRDVGNGRAVSEEETDMIYISKADGQEFVALVTRLFGGQGDRSTGARPRKVRTTI